MTILVCVLLWPSWGFTLTLASGPLLPACPYYLQSMDLDVGFTPGGPDDAGTVNGKEVSVRGSLAGCPELYRLTGQVVLANVVQ